ncbi:MAG: HEAT repeat domain-containing protein [Verrucomicrobia bacterium]|nr:HEAT repeat domain-containing protein [Verrucomicrobiota bacterium]
MNPTSPIVAGATLGAFASLVRAADNPGVQALLAKIKNPDDHVRGPAWQGAGTFGAPAVVPLGEAMTDPDFEIARAARRAIEVIVRHAGRPGAESERRAVAAELVKLLDHQALPVRRHALWMLSEIGDDEAVPAIARLLGDAGTREDARCALERIPGPRATEALKAAFAVSPEDFKYALAHTLRLRGEQVAGYPSRKLVPTKKTTLTE